MKIKRIGAQYFLNFGPWNEIYFDDDKDIISIIGSWADDPKRSNRSGKSSFVEMILYALYGKTRAKKEIDLINKNYEEDMLVEVEFDDGNIIKRGRTLTGGMILDLTSFEGADKKIIQDEINKLVGMTYEDFIMTSYFLQGDIHTFMESGPTGQKQTISRWLEKEYWAIYEKSAKDKLKDFEKETLTLQMIIDNKPDPQEESEIKANIKLLEDGKNNSIEVLNRLNKDLEDINGQLNKAKEKDKVSFRIEKAKKDVLSLRNDKNDMEDQVKDIENKDIPAAIENSKKIRELEKLLPLKENLQLKVKESKSKYNDLRSKLSDADAQLKLYRKQYNDMDKFDSVCPVMNKPCIAIDSITDAKEDITQLGLKKNIEVKKLKSSLTIAEEEYDQLEEELNDMNSSLKSLPIYKELPNEKELRKKINTIMDKIDEKKLQLEEKYKEIKELNELYESLDEIDIIHLGEQKNLINIQITDNQNQYNDIINNIATLKAKVDHIKELRQKAIKAQKDLKQLNEKINMHKIVSFMFSKGGIPSYQIETAFNEIEEEANIILEKIESDISIEFTPDRELNTWEENCLVCGNPFPKGYRKIECPECDSERQKKRKDELNIIIKTKDKEMDFNLESGGGKVLISLAIRLAFVRLLRRRVGANLNLLVFDEIFGMLDSVNRGLVFKLLTETLINDFGFDQIFAISHEEEIRDSIPFVIKVTKFDDHSIFNWE